VEASFTTVLDADREWRNEIGRYPARPIVGGLTEALSALLPLTGPQARYVWVSTTGGWTAYFDNLRNGSDPWSPIPYLSRRLGCRGVGLLWAPQTRLTYGGIRFDLYGQAPVDALNCTRTVSAINDARWVWTAVGAVQPFEDTASYKATHVKDRFAPIMLDRYCGALGIRPFDDSYYSDHALLVTNGDLGIALLTETLVEAQARMGIQVRGQGRCGL